MNFRILAFLSKTLVVATLLASQAVNADVLILKNGDRITGEIKRIWDSEITIEPEYSDEFSDKWVVPLGLGIGQITKFGKQPVNLQASVYYNVERPDQAARYQVRLQIQLMFPK